MDATQSAVVAAVVTALGKTIGTDTWDAFKKLLSRILGQGDPEDEAREEAQLDRDAARLEDARESGDEAWASRLDSKWSVRLHELLADHPESLDSLRALIEGGAGPKVPTSSQVVKIKNSASGGSRITSTGIGNASATYRD